MTQLGSLLIIGTIHITLLIQKLGISHLFCDIWWYVYFLYKMCSQYSKIVSQVFNSQVFKYSRYKLIMLREPNLKIITLPETAECFMSQFLSKSDKVTKSIKQKIQTFLHHLKSIEKQSIVEANMSKGIGAINPQVSIWVHDKMDSIQKYVCFLWAEKKMVYFHLIKLIMKWHSPNQDQWYRLIALAIDFQILLKKW